MYYFLGCFSQPLWASEILRVKGGTKILKYQMVTLRPVQCYNDQRGMRSPGFPKTAILRNRAALAECPSRMHEVLG